MPPSVDDLEEQLQGSLSTIHVAVDWTHTIKGTLASMFWGELRSVGVAPCMREILEAVEEGPWTVVVLSGKARAVFGRIPYRTVRNT